jgi:hypothetical protein
MKILKRIVIVVLVIIALLLIIALFLPRTTTVRVSETIHQPRQVVFDYVRMLDNQRNYSVWVMEDPDLVPEITGIDGTVGATQHWDSEKVGAGEQEITALSPDRMDVALHFIKPFEGKAKAAYIFTPVSETQTTVTSEFYSETPYPLNLVSYFFSTKMIEDAQTRTLQNLKRILE